MFLQKTLKNNHALIDFAFWAHKSGMLLPDTYVVDKDAVMENAAMIKTAADNAGLSLYFMLKQLGRNPDIARALTDIGFGLPVAVDFKETLGYINDGIPLGNVGHLVQIPDGALRRVLEARPEIVTVYSVEKAQAVSELAAGLGCIQDIMLRVTEDDDLVYSGQTAGFALRGLETVSRELKALRNIKVAGVCAFPCFIYDTVGKDIAATPNACTVVEAAGRLRALGHEITQINMPSAGCAHSMAKISAKGGTHAEPGHGLTGTTPWHAAHDAERQAVVYLSEISHNYKGKGYCYGGGHYRRGHLSRALTGASAQTARIVSAAPPDDDSIDYHFTLGQPCAVGDAVIMAFRTQIFVTRSTVALVEGISGGNPHIAGLYNSQGIRVC